LLGPARLEDGGTVLISIGGDSAFERVDTFLAGEARLEERVGWAHLRPLELPPQKIGEVSFAALLAIYGLSLVLR
jgi:hypothetical protein